MNHFSRAFPRVLAAESISNFGSMLSRLAIPWLAALTLGATPLQMGFLVVADVIAGALGSLALGAMIDRRDKRAVMLFTDFSRALVLAALATAAFVGALAFWMLVAAAMLTGLFTVAFEMARSAWMAERLPLAELDRANAQVSAASSLSETAAFALGGWLYQGLGAALALLFDAISYLASAACLAGVEKTARAPSAARSRLLAEMRAGIAAVHSHRTLAALAVIESLVALAMSVIGTSYMIFVARDVGFEPGVLGMIFASGGLGALAGAWLAPRIGRRLSAPGAMAAGLGLLSLATFCLPLAAGPTLVGAMLLIAHQVIGDGGHTVHAVYDRTLRQTAAPPDMLARADAAIRTMGYSARLIGALVGGLLATMLGTRAVLAGAAALLAVAAVAAWKRLN